MLIFDTTKKEKESVTGILDTNFLWWNVRQIVSFRIWTPEKPPIMFSAFALKLHGLLTANNHNCTLFFCNPIDTYCYRHLQRIFFYDHSMTFLFVKELTSVSSKKGTTIPSWSLTKWKKYRHFILLMSLTFPVLS